MQFLRLHCCSTAVYCCISCQSVFVFSLLSANIMNAAVNLVICNHYIASVDHAKLYFINSDYTTVSTHLIYGSSPTAHNVKLFVRLVEIVYFTHISLFTPMIINDVWCFMFIDCLLSSSVIYMFMTFHSPSSFGLLVFLLLMEHFTMF